MYKQGHLDFVARCRGHEAAQIGSAISIEVGKDFTLPYYRDLGVVLTIGMTPYEVFRTYLQTQHARIATENDPDCHSKKYQAPLHWGYHKHNMVTGPAPVATQILHAAGIAFASKLRKASVVTVAYCGDGATTEPDFLEGLRFAALHQLAVVFICEQDCTSSLINTLSLPSSIQGMKLPEGLTSHRVDGSDVIAVFTATQAAIQHAREGYGPTLLEMDVTRPICSMAIDDEHDKDDTDSLAKSNDPLLRCQCYLQERNAWDDEWAMQLHTRISIEVERAMQHALYQESSSIGQRLAISHRQTKREVYEPTLKAKLDEER